MFKKRFGMTPSEWRRQNLPKPLSLRPRGGFNRLVTRLSVMLCLLALQFLPLLKKLV
jgi:AraC-like DNA-binding protein